MMNDKSIIELGYGIPLACAVVELGSHIKYNKNEGIFYYAMTFYINIYAHTNHFVVVLF